MDLAALSVNAPIYDDTLGFLPTKAARLADIIHDYNPFLGLVFIPESNRDSTDTHPFAILDSSPQHPAHIVRHIREDELDNPQKILQWLFEGDLTKHGINKVMARVKAEEFARKILEEQKAAEIAAERQELAAALVSGGRDHKNSYRHNGKIFTDQGARSVSQTIH